MSHAPLLAVVAAALLAYACHYLCCRGKKPAVRASDLPLGFPTSNSRRRGAGYGGLRRARIEELDEDDEDFTDDELIEELDGGMGSGQRVIMYSGR